MKENWTYKPFMECIEKVKYTTKIQSKDFAEVGKYPIISQEDTYISGYWDNEADVFRAIRPLVIFGDHTRVLKYIDFDFVLGADGVKILLPIQEIMAKFMYYYILWYKMPNLGYSRHFKLFQDIKFPMAPMSTQQMIVQELDTINEVLSKKREQLKELDKLAQSIFYDMFGDPVTNEKGWEVKKLGEVGTFVRGSGLSKKDLIEQGFPCILYGQIHTKFGAFTKKHLACIPNDLVKTAKIAHPGDVILVLTSEDVEGSCKSTAWLGSYDIAIGSDAAIYQHSQNAMYVSFYTQTKAFFNEKSKYARGFKVTHISTKEIEKMPIPLPPLPLQQAFAEKIEKIEQMKQNLKASIHETETLLASRMSYWFE